MRDVKYDLHSAYSTLLTGSVIVPKEIWPLPIRPDNDYVVPVYDSIPANATFPYIKLQEWTEVDYSDKTSFGSDLTFTLQIVDRYQGTAAPKAVRNVITSKLKQIIRARPVPFDIFNWNIISSVVDNETTFQEMDDTHTYVYNNIRFRHLAEQLPLPPEMLNTFDNTFDNTFA